MEIPVKYPMIDSLGDAVRIIISNLPDDIELSSDCVKENFPKPSFANHFSGGVFAYQFMSTEGLNVATWIPSLRFAGVQMQNGLGGRGRPWMMGASEKEDISLFIEETKMRPVDASNEDQCLSTPYRSSMRSA